jgi:hypothetical protein
VIYKKKWETKIDATKWIYSRQVLRKIGDFSISNLHFGGGVRRDLGVTVGSMRQWVRS